ncbi:MFS transporter [Paracoccus panacisoli]|uniref:MFS transporter n=2 Tax=Paracoccus TaxID=265 RepID=A0ABV6T5A5_9RHOB
MLSVLRSTWPLLAGVMLLMVGNGMQGTLLGIRGAHEGIPTNLMSVVMSAYFGGFVLGSLIVPGMIQRVGHLRVFAALGSLISAVLILYAVDTNWIAWVLLRLVIGFSFCGVYITAESWMNASAGNETRGRAMSVYFIVQMFGLVISQILMNVPDPGGWLLFVIPSVLVSLAFTPILLSQVEAPRFESIAPMSIARLYRTSPLGCVGIFLVGGVFSALLGMGAVWGAVAGLNVREISAFVAAIWVGGLLAQYPVGWLSDRMDRRVLIAGLAILGTLATAAVVLSEPSIWGYLAASALLGGVANPIYALLIAYTNDSLDSRDMAAASAGLLLINGGGSVFGPIVTGWLMSAIGPVGFWVYILVLLAILSGYAGWRMTRRATPAQDQAFAILSPAATPFGVETALAEAGDSTGPLPTQPPADSAAARPHPLDED